MNTLLLCKSRVYDAREDHENVYSSWISISDYKFTLYSVYNFKVIGRGLLCVCVFNVPFKCICFRGHNVFFLINHKLSATCWSNLTYQ